MKLKNKTKRTLSAAAFLTAAIAAIILFNIVVGAAADKIQLRWDLTENKLYALTEETKSVLDGLSEEVTIYYFASSGQEEAQIVRTLDMYRTASDALRIVQSDPNTDPIAARRFTDKGISVQQNTIVVEKGERYKAIAPSEIYQSYTTQAGETMSSAFFGLEQLLTRAVAYVTSTDIKQVLFTVGHNEIDYTSVMETLQNENMEVYQIDLKTQDIPASANSLYIMAPAEDFTEEEILRLDAFLSSGKGVHIAFDARRKVLPRLEQYLKEFWGVTMYHDLVCEGDSSRTLNYAFMFIPDMKPHAVTQAFTTGNQSVVYMYSRSMELSTVENVTASPLASSTEASFSVHGSDSTVKENIREGALPLSAALERVSKEGYDRGRMVVSGSYQVYDSFFMEEASLANRSLLYGTANFVNHDEDAALSISPKSLLMRMVSISDGMTTFYIILVCVVPALLFFGAGIWTWKRRRHL